MTVETITSAALALPHEARAELVEALIRSLDDAESAKYWAEWQPEFDARLAAYDGGEMKAYSRDEVMRILEEDAGQ